MSTEQNVSQALSDYQILVADLAFNVAHHVAKRIAKLYATNPAAAKADYDQHAGEMTPIERLEFTKMIAEYMEAA